MKRDNWPVEEFGIRPTGSPNHCFYCGVERGGEHHPTCVIRERTVVVHMTVEYVITVPEFWTAEDIERHRNDGRWCVLNGLAELEDLHARTDDCFCDRTVYKYVREADAEDEAADGLTVEGSKS